MRKVTRVMLSVLCAGVLACGVGVGVAFAELTSLEYTGAHEYGMDNAVEVREEVAVPEGEGRILLNDTSWGGFSSWSFSYDETLPANTLVFDVVYDADNADYELHSSIPASYREREYAAMVNFEVHAYRSGTNDFFAAVEPFLAELREGRFGDYYYQGMRVDVRASANLAERVDFLSTVSLGLHEEPYGYSHGYTEDYPSDYLSEEPISE